MDTRKQATLPLPTDVTARLHAMSPVAHLHDIVSPVMLFLGELDRRVPASQGLAFASSLRSAAAAFVASLFFAARCILLRPLVVDSIARSLACLDRCNLADACRCLGKAAVEINSHDKDNHALDRSQTSFHCWMRIAAFFQLHTKAAA